MNYITNCLSTQTEQANYFLRQQVDILTENGLKDCTADRVTQPDFITLYVYLVQSLFSSSRRPQRFIIAIQRSIHQFSTCFPKPLFTMWSHRHLGSVLRVSRTVIHRRVSSSALHCTCFAFFYSSIMKLVKRHGASSGSGWRRRPPDMDGTCEYNE
jgi:hypothetical protein